MKKSTAWITALLVIIAIALCFVAVKFFILPESSTDTEVKKEIAPESAVQTKEEAVTTEEMIPEAKEGTTIIETNAPEMEIIDLTEQSSNDIRIETTGPLEYKTPESDMEYTKINMLGLNEQIWAYQDNDGNIQLRTYGVRWKKVNNVNQEQLEGFFKVDIRNTTSGKVLIEKEGAVPVSITEENFAVPEPVIENMRDSLDDEKYHQEKDNLFSCITKTGAIAYRTFAKVNGTLYLYDCDSEGIITKGSLPVCAEEELFNLVAYTEDFVQGTNIYSYPVKYNQTSNVFTIEIDRSNP